MESKINSKVCLRLVNSIPLKFWKLIRVIDSSLSVIWSPNYRLFLHIYCYLLTLCCLYCTPAIFGYVPLLVSSFRCLLNQFYVKILHFQHVQIQSWWSHFYLRTLNWALYVLKDIAYYHVLRHREGIYLLLYIIFSVLIIFYGIVYLVLFECYCLVLWLYIDYLKC